MTHDKPDHITLTLHEAKMLADIVVALCIEQGLPGDISNEDAERLHSKLTAREALEGKR